MNQLELISHFQNLKVHTSGGKRAPNKPLMLLLALGRLQQNTHRLIAFNEVEEQLEELIEIYGRPGKARPEYPFWHLRTAAFWEVSAEQTVPTQSGSASRKYLRDHQIKAGFTGPVYDLLQSKPELINKLATTLLQDHFPPTLHQEIAYAAGLQLIA